MSQPPVTVNGLVAELVMALKEAQPFVYKAGPYANSTYAKIDTALKKAGALFILPGRELTQKEKDERWSPPLRVVIFPPEDRSDDLSPD